eukprot:5948146-Pyramimonas_sp.AAC.1
MLSSMGTWSGGVFQFSYSSMCLLIQYHAVNDLLQAMVADRVVDAESGLLGAVVGASDAVSYTHLTLPTILLV